MSLNPEELNRLEEGLQNGTLTYKDVGYIFESNKKPWGTSEWKEKRKELLKDHCEQCDDHEGPFVLQHIWQPPEYRSVVDHVINDYVKLKLQQPDVQVLQERQVQQCIAEHGFTRDVCPECFSMNIQRRKNLTPIFRCTKCNHRFDQPVIKNDCLPRSVSLDRVRKKFVKSLQEVVWNEQHDEIRKTAILQCITNYRRYVSCADTITVCKKCAYLWEIKGMKLCSKCKTHYHLMCYEQCFECVKKEGKHPFLDVFSLKWP